MVYLVVLIYQAENFNQSMTGIKSFNCSSIRPVHIYSGDFGFKILDMRTDEAAISSSHNIFSLYLRIPWVSRTKQVLPLSRRHETG